MCDFSGLVLSDTLEKRYIKNRYKLPVDKIPEKPKECKENKALSVFK